MSTSRVIVAFMLLYLAIAGTIYIYSYVSVPEPSIVVPFTDTCMDIVLQGDGEVLDRRVVCSGSVLPLERGVRKIEVKYSVVPDSEIRFEIVLKSWHRVYVAPPSVPSSSRRELKIVSYSVYDAWWPRAPRNLGLALGGMGAYVEESMAGRLIEFLGHSIENEPRVRELLSYIEPEQRNDIAVAALWAAQLAREAHGQPPDIVTNFRGLEKVVGEPVAIFIAPIWGLGLKLLHYVPREEIYRSLLFTLRSLSLFNQSLPAWRAVNESTWIELCKAMENYTASPTVPSYAHSLVFGALIAAHGLGVALTTIFIGLIVLSLWLLTKLKGGTVRTR